MREVIRSQSYVRSLMLIVALSACASGAPNRPGREEAPITDPRDAGELDADAPAAPSTRDAGSDGPSQSGSDEDDEDADPMQGTTGGAMNGAAGRPATAQAGSAAMQAGTGGSAMPPAGGRGGQGGSGGAGAGGAGAGGAGAGGAGAGGAGAGGGGGGGNTPPDPDCFDATLLWSDGFETNDYRNWTSQTYDNNYGDACQNNAISTESAHGGTRSQRSEVVCTTTVGGALHRGYGGLQFNGDQVAPSFTNTGTGIDAPNGLVNTMWMRLDSDTVFDGRWISFLTVNADCGWSTTNDDVIGFGIEDSSGQLAAAHYQYGAGGSRTYTGAPPLPRGQWVRITTYVNYYTGVMHVWQNGQSQQHVTFSRPIHTICHFHWGLYASGNNDDIVLFEDDKSIWKLNEAWTDWNAEPYFGQDVAVCD